MTSDTSPITVRDIPIALWQQLKIKAAINGETVKSAVTKALQKYVEAA